MKTNDKGKNGIFGNIFKRFYPTYIFDKVEDIPYDLIEKEDIKLILIDMDNTLVNYRYTYTENLKNWINEIKSKSVNVHIFSNSWGKEKVKKLATELDLKYEFKASKPRLKGFKKLIQELSIPKENILMIGDQIFTDIWGGNRFGIKTILVKPVEKKEMFVTKIKRPFERIILNNYDSHKGDKND